MNYYLGVDIGGTKCAVCLWTQNGELLEKKAFQTESKRGYKAVIDDIIFIAKAVISNNGISPESVISGGISCGGPLDSKKGIIMSPPNLPDWDNVPITDILSTELGFDFYLQNDANACAIAEWLYGAGKGTENMVFLTFGTGMGAGLILNGKLYSGTNDYAGEAGHIRLTESGPLGYGKNGSFEGWCSGGGIAGNARTKVKELIKNGKSTAITEIAGSIENISTKDVAVAAASGDKLALEIFAECGKMLGKGLSVIIDLLNPEVIVIGSIFARSGKLLTEEMTKAIKSEALPGAADICRIVPAELGEKIGDFAALGVAREGAKSRK